MKTYIPIIVLLLCGCVHKPEATHAISTASLSGHLDAIHSNLSRVNGKAVVIESWLKSSR